jgi:hypothetical protein
MVPLVLGLCLAVAGDRTPAQAADAFLAAWRAKDEAAMQALAASDEPDPFLVADVLFGRYVAGSLREPPEPGDSLTAAAALAEGAARQKVNGELPALVRRWTALTTEDLQREARLREGEAGDADFSVTAVTRALRDAASELRRAGGLRSTGSLEAASRAYRHAVAAARAAGWKRARIDALHWLGEILYSRSE